MKTPTSCEQEIEKIPAGCTNRQAVLPAREHRTSLVLALASEPRVKPLAFGSTPFETQATTPLRKNLPWTAFFTGAYLALMGFGNLTGTVFAVKKLLPVIFHLPVPQILILLSMTCMNLAFAMIGGALLLRRAWARPLGLGLLIATVPFFAYGMLLAFPVEARGLGGFLPNLAFIGGWHTLMLCALCNKAKNG